MLVRRDCYARFEVHRFRVYTVGKGCTWCGMNKTTNKDRPYLFAYQIQTDGGRNIDLEGRYCSNSCMRAYQNEP